MSGIMNDQLESQFEDKLEEVKSWMKNQVEWIGRTDDDFIAIFLRSRDFDVDQTKKTLSIYYENKRKIPQWCTNRDLKDPAMVSFIHQRTMTLLIDKNPALPSLLITTCSRIGTDNQILNTSLKAGLIVGEILMRRPNCQMNGVIWIVDGRDHPWWPVWNVFSPTFIKNFINCYYLGMPIKLKKLIAINTSTPLWMFFNLLKPFLPHSLIGDVNALGSDLSSLPDLVPIELLPEELGGSAGPMKEHEDACINEIFAHTEYFADDDKYGFH